MPQALARVGSDIAVPLALVTDPPTVVANRIADALRMGLGEFFADTSKGVPWVQKILGQKNPNLTTIRNIIRKQILSDPDVARVVDVSVTFAPTARVFSYTWSAVLLSGDVVAPPPTASPTLTNSFNLAGGSGARAHTYYASTGVSQTSGTVTQWADQNQLAPANLVVNGTPGYNSSSATWTPHQPSVTTPGNTTTTFGANAVNLLSTDSIFFWAVVKWTSPGSLTETLFDYSSAAQTFQLAQNNGPTTVKPFLNDNARSIAGIASDIHAGPHLIWGFDQNAAVGSGGQAQISVDNAAPVTTTGTGPTITASGNVIQIGNNAQLEIVELGWVPFTGVLVPSASFLNSLHTWAQAQYGVP